MHDSNKNVHLVTPYSFGILFGIGFVKIKLFPSFHTYVAC